MNAGNQQPGTCATCGSSLPAGGREGLCPKCAWDVSMAPLAEELPVPDGPDDDVPWARLGDYDLHREIAHGGMGVVYRAVQRSLGRQVAVKVLRGGELAGADARRRFRREAEAAAQLQHPGVVVIHEVGEDQGVCWFSMDLVAGENLADHCARQPLAAREAAACVARVARAIHHAHQQGVLHRDLKPSNILLTPEGEPRVTDFGLARWLRTGKEATVASEVTRSGQTVGSPGYVAPEQALEARADERSDVYGLGAVLYHALTGRAPFHGPTLDSILLQLRESEPVPPRRLNPTVPRDLETVCLKCLEKRPAGRYATAQAVAEDLERFLAGEPLAARAVSPLGRGLRWALRRPALAGALALLAVAVAGGVTGIFHQWQRAETSAREERELRQQARESERAARLRSHAADMFAASQALLAEDFGRASDLVERAVPAPGAEDFRGPEWHWLWWRTRGQETAVLEGHPWIVACMSVSPDGAWLASGGRFVTGSSAGQSTLRVWSVAERRAVHVCPPGLGSVKALSFSPDGRRLFVVASGRARFLPVETWKEPEAWVPGATGVHLAHKGWFAVTAPDQKTVSVHDDRTLERIRTFSVPAAAVWGSRDGEWLAVSGPISGLTLLRADGTGQPRLFATPRPVNGAAFAPDGRWMAAVGGSEPLVWALDAPAPGEPVRLRGHALDVKGCAFSADGTHLVTTGSDRTVRFWRAGTWEPDGILRGHRDEVWCVATDPTGQWLATGSKDTTVRLWPARPPAPPPDLLTAGTHPPVWSRDSRQLALPLADGTGVIHDVASRRAVATLPWVPEAALADGGWTCFLEEPSRLVEWHPDGTTRTVPLEGNPPRFQDIDRKSWSADMRRFALLEPKQKVSVWDTATGTRVGVFPRPIGGLSLPVALNADGSRLAISGSGSAAVEIVDVATGGRVRMEGHSTHVAGLAFSPSGAELASASLDATIRRWDVATGTLRGVLRGHVQDVAGLHYSPDGRTLASVGNFEAVRLWHVETGTEVATMPAPRAADWVRFSPDGRWLAVSQRDPRERRERRVEPLLLVPTGPPER